MLDIAINPKQRLYIIATDDGVSCFGFDIARDHAHRIAGDLARPELELTPEEDGTPAGYLKYRSAVQAWSDSPHADTTYFGPRCSQALAEALETCRRKDCTVRLVLGDTFTGDSSFDEYGVIGRIGRSCGPLKVPLLLPSLQPCGEPVNCDRVLAVLEWETGLPVFRHENYRPPELRLAYSEDGTPWHVTHRDKTIARFDDISKAGVYIAFMRGASVDPNMFR